jgi:ferrochelatase
MKKIAIVLFNLGGPSDQDAVKPFLFNLFSDPAIIGLPQPLRYLVAKLISSRRTPIAKEIYMKMGGGSPILKNTEDQADALINELSIRDEGNIYRAFIAMRYWKPFTQEAVKEVKDFAPDQIILMPLYPQFSTTTTASSIQDWQTCSRDNALNVPTTTICCYPQNDGFINSVSRATREAYDKAQKYGTPRILFSAHGLPEKIIKGGDPYKLQCEMTVQALREKLAPDVDSVLCFQSRVGPLKWIGPATDDEVRRAARTKTPLVVVPIAFVSDHSETLVELNIEYRDLAERSGVPSYEFVPAVGTAPEFIAGLAKLIYENKDQGSLFYKITSGTGQRICPFNETASKCACYPTVVGASLDAPNLKNLIRR